MNTAYIDAQNLRLSTTKSKNSWQVDLFKFRTYLREKYNISKAYYFIGNIIESLDGLYDVIQEAGFILKFREHHAQQLSTKKGNVDSDIILSAMKFIYKSDNPSELAYIISGDGDYKPLVDFLILEKRFGKILLPNRRNSSSLYKKIPTQYLGYLDDIDVKRKIALKNK